MEIKYDILSEFLLEEIDEGLTLAKSQNRWSASTARWAPNIQYNQQSVITIYNITREQPDLDSLIKDELKFKLGDFVEERSINMDRLSLMFYHWHEHSSISEHNDYSKNFAGTLYLFKNWQARYGGLLMWQESSRIDPDLLWKAYVPKYNSLSLNVNNFIHHVSAVVPGVAEDRITIQMFHADPEITLPKD